ncbi:hypothetical protein SAMN05660236_5053 [Ohtaekwangia koreensis]|uniref:Uncharacterized protein n=1 Tax=Ohtaekwangia koreensis TaxID=688867 RepID=A0A1T5MCU8_9BACT|nr:hypothetical protein SAMN05660236_5053 [Ohtaekwangia koreensis]
MEWVTSSEHSNNHGNKKKPEKIPGQFVIISYLNLSGSNGSSGIAVFSLFTSDVTN